MKAPFGTTYSVLTGTTYSDNTGTACSVLSNERTTLVFSSDNKTRIIDRITTLKAIEEDLHFNDSKEGMYAIRVTKELELTDDIAVLYTDENGNIGKEEKVANQSVSGNYFSSEGLSGNDV